MLRLPEGSIGNIGSTGSTGSMGSMGNVGNVASGGSDTSGGGSAVRFGSNRGYGVPADLTTYIEFIYGSEVAALETSYIRFGAGEAATLYIIQLQWCQWSKGSTGEAAMLYTPKAYHSYSVLHSALHSAIFSHIQCTATHMYAFTFDPVYSRLS
jgi:hypothetical protein